MTDTEKQPEVYEVAVNSAYRGYVYATSVPKARARGLRHVEVRKLSGSEVAKLVAAGIAIDDGEDAQA